MAITLDGTNGINSSGVIVAPDGSASAPAITNDGDTNTGIFFPAADTIAFAEGGAEAMRITSAGRLGLGTTTPGYNQTIFGGGNTFLQISQSGDSVVGSIIGRAGSTSLRIQNSENAATEFWTNNTERARITSGGDLLVGTTTTDASCRFSVQGAVGGRWGFGPSNTGSDLFRVQNSNTTGVYLTNGGTSWTANSDERLKTDLQPILDAANKVSTLRAVTGRYKTDLEGTSRSFLIAQDVQEVFPEAVNTQDDEFRTLGLQYTDMVPLLTAAIQELKAELDEAKARIAALEGAQA